MFFSFSFNFIIYCSFLANIKQNYAKRLVNADRTAVFLLDRHTNEVYARVFDGVPLAEIRFEAQ